MTPNSNIKLTIVFNDPELDADDRDEQAQRLLGELRQLDEVETVDRVLDPNPPEGNKAIGGDFDWAVDGRGQCRQCSKSNGVSGRSPGRQTN